MGMISTLVCYDGCDIDVDRYKVYMNLIDMNGDRDKYLNLDAILLHIENTGTFVNYFDEYKIEEYWNSELCKTLQLLCNCIKKLNDNGINNYMEFETERGYNYKILFRYDEKGDEEVNLIKPIMYGMYKVLENGGIDMIDSISN